jgi:hypothetical protein
VIVWRADAQGAREAIARIERSTAVSAQAAEAMAKASAQSRTRTVTIVREVSKLVTPDVDARYPLPVGLVRLHDAAARGVDLSAVPDAAGRADGAPASVDASHLAAVVATNYGACLEDQARLAAWQAWARARGEALR